MTEIAPDRRLAAASTPPRVPAEDLILPVLDLAAAPRRAARAAPAVIGAGDLMRAVRADAPRPAAARPAAPSLRPAPALSELACILRGLRRSANDNRVRITVWTAILLLLLTHTAATRIAPQLERVIEVPAPVDPGRMISAL